MHQYNRSIHPIRALALPRSIFHKDPAEEVTANRAPSLPNTRAPNPVSHCSFSCRRIAYSVISKLPASIRASLGSALLETSADPDGSNTISGGQTKRAVDQFGNIIFRINPFFVVS